MALMERVATLLRADIDDLIERTEDPEKMLEQLVLDMENQLLQVKTQVAMALADQHLLERKTREQEEAVAGWYRKAELAVNKGDDALARAALKRALSQENTLAAFRAQVSDQTAEAEALRVTYAKLQGKLAETEARCEVLIRQHRRARMMRGAAEAGTSASRDRKGEARLRTVGRVGDRLAETEAQSEAAKSLLSTESLEERFAQLERDDRVEQLLTELKDRQQRLLPTG